MIVINTEISLWASVEQIYFDHANQARHSHLEDLDSLHHYAVASTMEVTITALLIARKVLPIENQESLQYLVEKISHIINAVGADTVAAYIGTVFERLRGRRLALGRDKTLITETSPDQRSRGVYFTPLSLADAMSTSAIIPILDQVNSIEDLRKIAIIDPAVGCGALLLSSFRIIIKMLEQKTELASLGAARLRQEVAEHCIYGVDIDPIAIATVRALLIAEVGVPNWESEGLNRHLHIGDSISTPVKDWWKWFPERASLGFNVVITNPPWSKLRPLRHEFFEHIDKNVRLFQGKALGIYLKENMDKLLQGSWSHYVNNTIELSNKLRNSDEYIVNQSSFGDPDLYKYFLERSIAILSQDGIASLLTPSGVLRAKGSAPIRKLLREKGDIVEIVEYINRKRLFEIHPMYRFSTILFKKSKENISTFVRFGQTEPTTKENEGVYIEPSFFDLVGGEYALIPEVRNNNEKDLLTRLYTENPINKSIGGENLSFKRELDMTNDSKYFIESIDAQKQGFLPQPDGRWLSSTSATVLLPVYEGRMVQQYDNTAKEYQGGSGRSARWNIPCAGQGLILPHFFVTEEYAVRKGWKPVMRIGYCEISGHANERTVLAAQIPPYAICGNKVPTLRICNNTDFQLLWLALANSLITDWVVRRWVSTTINHFYWKNIIFPNSMSNDDKSLLVKIASQLCLPNSNNEDTQLWLGKRAQLQAAIDAIVINSYNISKDELKIILNDFPLFNSSKKHNTLSLYSLLELYIDTQNAGKLSFDEIYNLCDPRACASIYATRKQSDSLKYNFRSTPDINNKFKAARSEVA